MVEFSIEHQIGLLQVNRPESRNALSWITQEQFAKAVAQAAQTPQLRVLIVTGSGSQAFISGGDLKELSRYPEKGAGERLNQVMGDALNQLTQLPLPVIAAINGDAIGGGLEVALACDLRLMTATARLRFAQVGNGLTTGWGGTGRVVRLLGQSRATELLLTGRVIEASEAANIGLVHRLVPAGADPIMAAKSWATELATLPADALAALKKLLYAAGQLSVPEVNKYEAALFVGLWGEANHQEALAAFAQKRTPRFNRNDSNFNPMSL